MRIKETGKRGRCEAQLKEERAAAGAMAWTTSHGRRKVAVVYDAGSEIPPNMDSDESTSSIDPSSRDFLIQSDVFFAMGGLDAKFTVLELEACNHGHPWLQEPCSECCL